MSKAHHLPQADQEMLGELSLGLEGSENIDLTPPAELYKQYGQVRAKADEVKAKAFHVVDQFQAWRSPMHATEELGQLDGLIQELEKFNERLKDELEAALLIKNDLILDTVEGAFDYVTKLPAQPRVAAQTILAEYDQRLKQVEQELHRLELIKET